MKVQVIPPAYTWESQAQQYKLLGSPGLGYEYHMVNMDTGDEVFGVPPGLHADCITVIDCLLHRGADGKLDAILNHYDGRNPLEAADNINVWVRPDRQRQGLATLLITEAMRRWPEVTLEKQRYTPDGVRWLQGFIRKSRDGKAPGVSR